VAGVAVRVAQVVQARLAAQWLALVRDLAAAGVGLITAR